MALIIGAGATLSDALSKPLKTRPPLDRGFFRAAMLSAKSNLAVVQGYLGEHYDIDPTDVEDDSLEDVMAIIYSDLYNPAAPQNAAADAFRSLLRLLNRRLAETTNPIVPGRRSNLYRILRTLLDDYRPEDISIITFNQDLQIEKTLFALQ